jgi:hypothetical protein
MLDGGYVHHLHLVKEENYANLFIKILIIPAKNKGGMWWVPDIALISSKDGVARIAMAK